MSIADSDDLDMNLSEPEADDTDTSLSDHSDLDAALSAESLISDEDDGTDILANLDDDPLDLSLGGDADEAELEAAFQTDTAMGTTDDFTSKSLATDEAEEDNAWEDAPENLTGNFTDLAQQNALDLPAADPEDGTTPTLTSQVDSPLDLNVDDEEMAAPFEDDPSVESMISSAQAAPTDTILKRLVAGIVFLLLGGGGGVAILLFSADSRINALEMQLSSLAQPQSAVQTGIIQNLQQRINTLSEQVGQATQLQVAGDDGNRDIQQFNDKIGQLQTAFEQLSQTIQTMQTQRSLQTQAKAEPVRKIQATAPLTGEWAVNLMSFARKRNALNMQQQLSQKGLDTEIQASKVSGKTWYRLRISGQPSREDAAALQQRLRSDMGLRNTWLAQD